MKGNNKVKPEFDAKLRKVGDSYVVTVPRLIMELWSIGIGEKIRLRILEVENERK